MKSSFNKTKTDLLAYKSCDRWKWRVMQLKRFEIVCTCAQQDASKIAVHSLITGFVIVFRGATTRIFS